MPKGVYPRENVNLSFSDILHIQQKVIKHLEKLQLQLQAAHGLTSKQSSLLLYTAIDQLYTHSRNSKKKSL